MATRAMMPIGSAKPLLHGGSHRVTSDGLMHARMQAEDRDGETRIISISALMDRHFYTPALEKIGRQGD